MLAAMLVTGIAATGCSDEITSNGGVPNGGKPNGDEPNGGEPVEPDFTGGTGLIIDCDENTGDDPEAGDPAFDFRFQDAVGTTFALSDFRGRVVVLNFWRTQCSYCVTELPHLQQLYDQWPATELVLLTIAKGEEPATMAAFMQDEGYSFPVIVDEEEKVSTQYRVTGLPRTFFIDSEGYILGIKRGYFHTFEDIEEILNQIFGD